MSTTLRTMARAAVTGALVAGALAIPTTPALAKPAGCSGRLYASGNQWAYEVQCSGGTGYFRAYMDCWFNGSYYASVARVWNKTGVGKSIVYCKPGESYGKHFAQLADDI